jgi:hypothetical protein
MAKFSRLLGGSALLKEPLVHFLVAGGLIFAAYSWMNPPSVEQGQPIEVGERDLDWLAQMWSRQWNRPPSKTELRGMVIDFLRESLLAREAEVLGLDRDDTVIRRRLAQKMTFLFEDIQHLAEPAEAELRAYHAAHRGDFVAPARISFTQVFFRGQSEAARAGAAAGLVRLASLRDPAAPADLGDSSLLPREFHDAELKAVASQFGDDFARQAARLAPGSWQGPVASSYGLHLVHILSFTPEQRQSFEAARSDVTDKVRELREKKARDEYFAALVKKYGIRLDERAKALVGSLEPLRSDE